MRQRALPATVLIALMLAGVGIARADHGNRAFVRPPAAKIAQLEAQIAAAAAKEVAGLPALREKLGVISRPAVIAGVPVFIVEPKSMPRAHKDDVILSFHGGGYIEFPGESGTREAVFLAALGGYRVIAVDYRMAPDHPFPAAMDDAAAVYKAVLATVPAPKLGLFGTSAGGGIVLALCLRAKAAHLPLPAVIAAGMPYAEIPKQTLYTAGHSLADPQVSPLRGDFTGLPPTILTTGTRDFFLAVTLRVAEKLKKAGVQTKLQVFDGMVHAGYLQDAGATQTKDAFNAITLFFDAHLAH